MDLIKIGIESETVEFKKSTGELKEAIISIASILTKHNKGVLYFGVKNDGTVIGQDINDDSLRKVSQAIGNHISPTIYPEISVETFGSRQCIKVSFEGHHASYLAYNIPRIRVADEDLVLDQTTYNEMLAKRNDISYSWEQQTSKYTVNDIDQSVFRNYLNRSKEAGRIEFEENDPRIVLDKLGLTEGEHLLNAGAALFCDTSINELQMAKFATNERLTFTDIRRFTGSIFDLVKKAEQYVIDAMDWRVEIGSGLSRKEIPEIPVEALREAIINSFGHRIFGNGQSNEVAVFKDRIEIYNPGALPEGLSFDDFINGNSRPIRRNPLIARTLYYSKDMESFATGLKRIISTCENAGCKVEFYQEKSGVVVTFYRSAKNIQDSIQDSIHDKLLHFCESPKSKKEIMEFLGYKTLKSTSQFINKLIDSKQLQMTIPDKPNSRNQKYISTK